MDRLEVARFSTLPEAELAVSLLRQHGIDATVADRETANSLPHLQIAMGGLRVVVPDAQIVEARQIIARVRAGEFNDDDDEDGDWRIDATPGKIGELDEADITRPIGCGWMVGGTVILLLVLTFVSVARSYLERGY